MGHGGDLKVIWDPDKPEEVAAYREAMGIPAEAKAYDLKGVAIDEADQPREVTRPGHDRTPSGRIKPAGVPDREPFFDAAPEDRDAPANVDLHGRLSLLEQLRHDADARHKALADRIKEVHDLAERSGTWNRRIVYALSGLAGVAGTALVFAFTLTRASGDAAGEKRARDIERARYIALIDRLVVDVSRHDGILSSLVDAVRARYPVGALPLIGPPPAPSEP